MLQANKARVVADLAYETLEIRHLELRYWMEVFKKFGVLAAFLGGFASSVMLLNTAEAREARRTNVLFVLASGGAMGCNLVLLTVSVICCLWGPGRALTGRGSKSYTVAIEVLEKMYRHCMLLFRMGLLCYLTASIFAVFSTFPVFSAALISLVFLFFGYVLVIRAAHLKAKFVPQYFTSGALRANPVRDIGDELTARQDPGLAGFALDATFGQRI
ncbi:hypothetical protein BESB_045440 [Besnoitia besnoiti]|uniref:Transmembrane protein n=1 Tax=Besnoitia besnoiti TaxID=94643 RepID=A0A2A9MLM2_BESBE|nr:hypothetical protein BESB_045440 [Besnoitia besnoiti]PFH36352.1 hypothetical protein BESB_045440 [Besnoitia besnoiti]